MVTMSQLLKRSRESELATFFCFLFFVSDFGVCVNLTQAMVIWKSGEDFNLEKASLTRLPVGKPVEHFLD